VCFDRTAVVVEVHDESMLQPCIQPLNLRGPGPRPADDRRPGQKLELHPAPNGKTIRAVIIPEYQPDYGT
jgi:hypothetical protein